MSRTSAAISLLSPRSWHTTTHDPDADQREEEARTALQSLGVVRVPLPRFSD